MKSKLWDVFSVPLQTPCCVCAVLTLGSVCFLEPASLATEVSISHLLDSSNVYPATKASTQSNDMLYLHIQQILSLLCLLPCFIVCFAPTPTVSLEVHYVTPVLVDPSTITLVVTVAQVVHQVCLFSHGQKLMVVL